MIHLPQTPFANSSKRSKPGISSITPCNTLNSAARLSESKSRLSDPSPQSSLGDSTSLFDSFTQTAQATTSSATMARENVSMDDKQAEPMPTTSGAAPSPMYPTLPQASQPRFGATSSLQNRLPASREKNSIFYIPKKGVPRPEHHRPQGNSTLSSTSRPDFNLPQSTVTNDTVRIQQSSRPFNMPASTAAQQQPFIPHGAHSNTTTAAFSVPSQQSQHSMGNFSSHRPLQSFSSLGDQSFRPVQVNPSHPSTREVHDLTRDDSSDSEYNPDAFISKEPIEYMSTEAANDNIKALLEGAFAGEEQSSPQRRRLPRGNKIVKVVKDVSHSLADKLRMLDVKDDATHPQNEANEEQEDEGFVDGLSVKLLPHQVEGVTWMLDKESGEKKKGIVPNGGILADDMGLGKTIQALSLMLLNPRPTNESIEAERKAANKRIPRIPLKTSHTTLVVAPLALIRQWEAEISAKADSLRVLVHHGSNRTQSAKKLESYDVVITTYQTLTSEHESSSINGPQVGCLGVHWYRVILDEAHSIKNRNAKMTKACYALRSVYRWCLTGTPMQNNLDELQSLIRFLNIRPYNDFNRWKEQITIPMKNGRGDLAMRRLQTVLMAFMKRRTKDILKEDGAFGPQVDGEKPGFQIVDRKVELLTVEFSEHERRFYDKLDARAQENLLDVMSSEKNSYMAILVLLLRLRQSCNHPRLMTAKTDKDCDMMLLPTAGQQTPSKVNAKDVDDIADLMGGLTVDTRKCDVCRSTLTKQEISEDAERCTECEGDLKDELSPKQRRKEERRNRKKSRKDKLTKHERLKLRKARRQKLVIDSDDDDNDEWIVSQNDRGAHADGNTDTEDEEDEGRGRWLGDEDSETGEDDSDEDVDDGSESDESDAGPLDLSQVPVAEFYGSRIQASTKILHLLDILEKETPSHKVIVFSEFTSMLDLIEPFLAQKGFKWSRYDGSMRNDAREASLDKLRNDKRTRILLCSLKCGSLGLNLTAASRVVLMEPFWNPAIEDQAIDRVHRLNQTRDILVYRLTIAGTIEDRILELQEKKRALAAAALGGDKNISKLNMQDLLDLFRHDHYDGRAGAEDGQERSGIGRMIENFTDSLLPSQSSKSKAAKANTPARRTVEHPVYGRR